MSTEESKKMLRRHVYSKTNLVIMFVDINDSTNMSLSLSQNKFALIMQTFANLPKPNQVLVGELIDNIFLSTPSTKNLKRFREIGSDPNRWNYRSHINGSTFKKMK
jgi:hypothetical protein